MAKGQARKSLWIETFSPAFQVVSLCLGQARKSLWIETFGFSILFVGPPGSGS